MAIEYPTRISGGIVCEPVTFDLQTATTGDVVMTVNFGQLTPIYYLQLAIDQIESNSGGTAASAGFRCKFEYWPGTEYVGEPGWNSMQTDAARDNGPTIADLNSDESPATGGWSCYAISPYTGHAVDGALGTAGEVADFNTALIPPKLVTGFQITYYEADDFTAGQYTFYPVVVTAG